MEIERKSPQAQPGDGPSLDLVLLGFEAFLTESTMGIIEACPEGETRMLAESTSATLNGQLKKVHVFIRESHERLSGPQKAEFQTFLKVQEGVAMAQQGVDTCRAMFKKGGFGKKFLKWILKWFQEIKKLLNVILDMLCDIFGWTLPAWVNAIFLLLDELKNFLAALLGESIGLEVKALEREFSASEVNYLREMTQLTHLQNAARAGRKKEEES